MRKSDFTRDYELGRTAVLRELECCVLGCDYGGTSWTTRSEASRITELLEPLLRQSGWKPLACFDVTKEFAQTLRTSMDGMTARSDAITEVVGATAFSERMKRRQDTLAAVARGLLKREIFVARVA